MTDPAAHPTLFVTGNSSGLGRGLTQVFLDEGWEVFGVSRRGCDLDHPHLHDLRCDLSELDRIPAALERFLEPVDRLDLVVLNAGILGSIQPITETSLDELRQIMDVNVWANKVILDLLAGRSTPPGQIILISSGAAVLGSRGWSGYALSKATLNMLGRLYAQELTKTHVSALAPGLIDSEIMDYLCEVPDPEEYPSVARIREARGTPKMPPPREAARRILQVLPELRDFPSGDFVDIRQIQDPEEYEKLMARRRG